MEVAGSAFPITPLLSTCTKIVTILHNVGKKFKRAPLMMTSIATECSLIHVALAQLRSFDWAVIATHADGRQEQLTRATESIILGCTLTLSVIEEYAIELQDYVDGAPLSPTEQMGIMTRVRVLWKEDEMRELLLQLRGYQTGLTSLIREAHDSDFNDGPESLSGSSSNYTALLQRSRSSRSRKPLSIRAAMQQAATYTSFSKTTATTPTTSSHSSQPSTSTVQSRQSTAASSIANTTGSSRVKDGESFSSIAVDAYDSGANAAAGKKSTSDNVRRKRPAFLSLQSEESDTIFEGASLYTKRSKDQMRKSSPTVGERFKFVPGLPPPPSSAAIDAPLKHVPPAIDQKNYLDELEQDSKKAKRPSKDSFHEPPTTSPPLVPLPEPPSREPSRSRSPPPKSPVKSILRNTSKTDLHNTTSSHRRRGSSSPAKRLQIDYQSGQDSSSVGDNDFEKPLTPVTPQTDISIPPTPHSGTFQPRKQKSNSSVRDQIMVLPETARLRKQASNDILRKQSNELLGQTGLHDAVPSLPKSNHDRFVVGNAFGRRGSNAASQLPGISSSGATSFDLLTDVTRQRSAVDAMQSVQNAATWENKVQIPLHVKRGLQRSPSDARRPERLQFLNIDHRLDGRQHSPSSDAVSTPSTIATPTSQLPHSAATESWPLSQGQGYQPELSQHQTNYGKRNYPQPSHARSSSRESTTPIPSRSMSPETTQDSRSITPQTNMSRQRSRSNTLQTIESEMTESSKQTVGDVHSLYGSAAPSVMSAQWYKSPQERLDIGPRVSRAETIPWELGGESEANLQLEQAKSRFPQKPRMFGVFPAHTQPRINDHALHSPPRSPLLTDGFLNNVKQGLPKDSVENDPIEQALEPVERPSTSMKSRGDSSQSDTHSKKSKKDKKNKDFGRPSMKELWGAYKDSSNSWYTAQYQRAAEEQRVESTTHDKRPASRSTNMSGSGRAPGSMDAQASSSTKSSKIPTPRQSTDRGASISSGSVTSRMEKEKKKKKKGGGFFTVKELWSEYKSNTNQWYNSAYKEDHVRDLQTPQPQF